jgi:geranylgeranyl reductase family protein
MEIAVVGGGPGGCWSAILLARRGHAVTLIDPRAPWEKPCGGGITTKALQQFKIFESDLPRKNVEKITIFFGDQSSVSIAPQMPLSIVSRKELGRYLLEAAAAAGVRFLHDRVTQVRPSGSRWHMKTKETALEVDFVVGADGATSFVRRTLGTALGPEDLCITLGYFIPSEVPATMKIFFVPALEGYLWSFPRPGHISYGLISRSGPGRTAKARELLTNFILADLGAEVMEHAEFYSAPVPCLSPQSWKNNVVAGERWALVGDAAGLVDPITGEGIYFAFRSAEILAETIDQPGQYSKTVLHEIGRELARASRMYGKFYSGRFLGGDFRKRTIQLARRSRTVRQILGNLIAGNQPYLGLKKKLVLSVPSVGWDLVSGRK